MSTQTKLNENLKNAPGWVETVRRHVASLRFGVVQIVVHNSQVTEIDKTERVRLDKPTEIPESE